MSTQSTRYACWDIPTAYSHLAHIYADANALTSPLDERFAFLTVACGDLSRCYRKKTGHLYSISIAQAFAWFMSLGEELFRSSGGTILANAMGEKYPPGRCGYCKAAPCVCKEESRAEHTPSFTSIAQKYWTIHEWQTNLHSLYGNANSEGGVPRALNRLFEEVAEIGLILHQADGFNEPLDEVRRKIAREMTDVLAWLFAIASLLDIDVEKALRAVYEHGCPVCRKTACACRNFEKRPQEGSLTHRFMQAEEIQTLIAS